MENAPDVREAHSVAAVGEPPGRAEIGGGMNYAHMCRNDHPEVGHNVSDNNGEIESSCPVCVERARGDVARELAKRWRDAYEWDAVGDPLPVYNFPWEEKP